MNSESSTTLNVKGLDQLLKALKQKQPRARVGILGDGTMRKTGGGKSNAEIGAMYEYSLNPDKPGGSFLRIPISDHLDKRMKASNALDKNVMNEVIKSGSVIPWLKKITILAEQIVQDAFDSCGFGKWKPSNMAYKKNHQTLVETKQLRESITSEVKA